ncbi:lysozyme C [Electrophorus electricus]|uniref:lysozyme n=1 Tax=Electrophorus electricus TaxID=8005 RepID=A0A4W4FTX7_ELEEL|nr:lysozyme C [Electrophorus electricus]
MRLVVVVCLMWLAVCESRRLSRCEVVRIFKQQGLEGFEGFNLGNYVCMAYWESKWKTHKVRDSSEMGKDYGIFQINSFKWCEDGTVGGKNLCKLPCGALLNDNLKASIDCLKLIVRREGLKSWDTWDNYCNGRKMSRWVRGCGLM